MTFRPDANIPLNVDVVCRELIRLRGLLSAAEQIAGKIIPKPADTESAAEVFCIAMGAVHQTMIEGARRLGGRASLTAEQIEAAFQRGRDSLDETVLSDAADKVIAETPSVPGGEA